MTQETNPLLAMAAAAASTEDMNETTSGFVKTPARHGVALFRLRDYIELGTHQPKNASWKPAVECMLTFELLHPDHLIVPQDKTKEPFPETLTVRLWKSTGKGSRFVKLFNAMNYAKDKTHFVQMVGQSFLGFIHHNVVGKDTYVNLNDESGAWTIGAPSQTDAISNVTTQIPVPELHGTMRMFIWENAGWTDEMIKMGWDTLYIDGVNAESGKSKNWIQETIMNALDWENSATSRAVEEGGFELPAGMEVDQAAAPLQEAPQVTAPAEPSVDVLAGLGL